MATVRTLRELEELEGWLTFGEAAVDLGVTGERVRQMAIEGKLSTAKRIGRRPVGIVREDEVLRLAEERKAREEERGLSA